MKNFCIIFAACFICFALGNVTRTAGALGFSPAGSVLDARMKQSGEGNASEQLQVLPGSRGHWINSRVAMLMLSFSGLGGIALATWALLQHPKIKPNEARVIAEQERKRIAREIHDSLQQQLSGAALHLETLKGAMQAAPLMMPRLINEATAMIRHCQIETRHCIWDLRSSSPKNENFADTLFEWMSMRATQIKGTKLNFSMNGEMPPMSEDVLFQVMRIIQEAVNNGLAHADARHVNVCLEATRQEVFFTVKDDGRGFQPYDICEGHFGISGQRERAQRIGAKLLFSSAPGNGTRVLLRVPAQQHSHV